MAIVAELARERVEALSKSWGECWSVSRFEVDRAWPDFLGLTPDVEDGLVL